MDTLDGSALDGNAIGGLLIDVFGTEMTMAGTTCAACGASRLVAELLVYRRAPGTVVRCRTCGAILMVLVTRNDVTSVDLSGLASFSQPGTARNETAKGRTMSQDESMSMGQPDEGAMSMGQPDEGAMSMGQPGEDAMSMGQPDEGAMSMGQPGEDAMSMGQPDEGPMSMGQPGEN